MRQLSLLLADHDAEAVAMCLVRPVRSGNAGMPLHQCRSPAARGPSSRRRRAEFIDVPPGMMLGVHHDRYPTTEARLAPGSVLALYTDGLVEQPGQDIGVGMSWPARMLAASPVRSLDHLSDAILAVPGPYAGDDIALLLARTADTAGHDTDPG